VPWRYFAYLCNNGKAKASVVSLFCILDLSMIHFKLIFFIFLPLPFHLPSHSCETQDFQRQHYPTQESLLKDGVDFVPQGYEEVSLFFPKRYGSSGITLQS
jgi:hypothetical protein